MKFVNQHHYWKHIPLRQIFTYLGTTFPRWSSPLFVMRVWSSVRSGLLFSHWMYFFHISTCWASWGEFWGGTEGAFRSSPFITVSYSWITQTESSKLVHEDKTFWDVSERFKTDQWHSSHLRHSPGIHVVSTSILDHLFGQVYIYSLFTK